MTLFHFFNCAILTFGPHAVYYSATPLYEQILFSRSVISVSLLIPNLRLYLDLLSLHDLES